MNFINYQNVVETQRIKFHVLLTTYELILKDSKRKQNKRDF